MGRQIQSRNPIGTLVVFAALAVLVIFAVKSLSPSSLIPDFLKKNEVEIVEGANIVEDIRRIAEYTTATYHDEILVENKKFGYSTRPYRGNSISQRLQSLISDPMGQLVETRVTANVVLILRGECKAGFDLEQIQPEDIYFSGDTVTVILPDPKILETIVNPSDYEIFDSEGKWTDAELSDVIKRARITMTRDATRGGLLEKALSNGKAQIENFLKMCGYSVVRVMSESEAIQNQNRPIPLPKE